MLRLILILAVVLTTLVPMGASAGIAHDPGMVAQMAPAHDCPNCPDSVTPANAMDHGACLDGIGCGIFAALPAHEPTAILHIARAEPLQPAIPVRFAGQSGAPEPPPPRI